MPITERMRPEIFRAPRRIRKDRIQIDPDFGNRLRALRESRGLKQADFLVGRSSRNISLIETGQRRAITIELAQEIAERCGITVEDLLMPPPAAFNW